MALLVARCGFPIDAGLTRWAVMGLVSTDERRVSWKRLGYGPFPSTGLTSRRPPGRGYIWLRTEAPALWHPADAVWSLDDERHQGSQHGGQKQGEHHGEPWRIEHQKVESHSPACSGLQTPREPWYHPASPRRVHDIPSASLCLRSRGQAEEKFKSFRSPPQDPRLLVPVTNTKRGYL